MSKARKNHSTIELERRRIRFNRKTSNFFWGIVDILAHKNRKIAELYEKLIGEEYKKECEKFDLSENSKILHIGCGAYPLTEITLAKSLGVEIVGIDKNPKAVKLANEVILERNLDGRIKINLGDGLNYPVDDFDVIILSSCSLPKLKILENILKTAKKDNTIIVRETDVAIDHVLEGIDLQDNAIQLKKIHHNPFPFLGPLGWNAINLKKK